ncbi:ebe5774f-0f90-42c8-84c5-7700479af2f1 [Thermothielavioides terrestris]|uniref:Ebe5774f-0f90-42c8-84c5-7700479af2f1 n=1 Tax=Thermothielavioides terrestris TaxID=2587410 RepID=A0A446BCA4_9PEZI|nr:ebe5774f-0f90-42c8-84c5-7700479af2f1 [Thermothielavioides terrestris]
MTIAALTHVDPPRHQNTAQHRKVGPRLRLRSELWGGRTARKGFYDTRLVSTSAGLARSRYHCLISKLHA